MQEYQELLYEFRESLHNSAKKYVPRLYDSLRKGGLTPQEARSQIEKDLEGDVTHDTVVRYLPQEAKDKKKSYAAKFGALKTKISKSLPARNPAQISSVGAEPIPITKTADGESVPYRETHQAPRKSEIAGTLLIDLEKHFPELQRVYRSGIKRTWLAHNGREVIAVQFNEARIGE